MRITVFTSNQPRHISLIETLARIAEKVYAIQECATVFPGEVSDFWNSSPTMKEYFGHVMRAEGEIFGGPRFCPENVVTLALKAGDLSRVELEVLEDALDSDYYVVFGAGYIKGPLVETLVERRAINIHMGVSPQYRGNSCNFWALYDGNPELVGASIHMLSKGLDSGPILFHAFPRPEPVEAFLLGMKAVKAAHEGLASRLRAGTLFDREPVVQDKSLELRYTRHSDFTDEVARAYLENTPDRKFIEDKLNRRDSGRFVRPYIG